MNTPEMLLDLDDPDTWESLELSKCMSTKVIKEIKEINRDELDALLFFGELDYREECVTHLLVKKLMSYTRLKFHERYTHVCFYHACRCIDQDSYLRNGVYPLDFGEVSTFAEKFFQGCGDVRESLSYFSATGYVHHNSESVGGWSNRPSLLESGYQYTAGPEILRNVANRLGDAATKRISALPGHPAMVRCKLPVSWLVEGRIKGDLGPYYCYPLRQVVRSYLDIDSTVKGGAMMVKGGIPPEYVEMVEYIDHQVPSS